MKQIILNQTAGIMELKKQYCLESFRLVNIQTGYDDAVYLLFSGNIPEQINGIYVNTEANTEYRVLCLYTDWTEGSVLGGEVFQLGTHRMNFHFVQPIGDKLLLLGSRCRRFSDGTSEKNAVLVSKTGQVVWEKCFGDGIQDCVITRDAQILTSYFDEGVWGNMGWTQPIGSCGIIKWDGQGNILWKNKKYDICDCYVMTVDDRENLWFYYYTDFDLVKTDFKQDRVYSTGIEGSNAFLFTKDGKYTMFDGGYNRHSAFKGAKLLDDGLGPLFDIDIVEGEGPILPRYTVLRGSKAVFVDNKGKIYLKGIDTL